MRVLVAVDREFMASRLVTQLAGLGHHVVGIAKDATAAAEAARQAEPDLVLLDVRLPPSDGVETARTIFSRHPVPCVLLTGYVGADLVRRGQDAGIFAFLVWPAEAGGLASAIKVALTRFREFRMLAEHAQNPQAALRAGLVVARAKRMVGRRLDLTDAEAFRYLRRQSRITGLPLEELAAGILTAVEFLFGKPDAVSCLTTVLDALRQRELAGPPRIA